MAPEYGPNATRCPGCQGRHVPATRGDGSQVWCDGSTPAGDGSTVEGDRLKRLVRGREHKRATRDIRYGILVARSEREPSPVIESWEAYALPDSW